MKKLVIILFVFFFFILFGYINYYDNDIAYRYEEKEYTYVFTQNTSNELIGVKVEKTGSNLNEEIREVFNYLTKNNGCLPVGYKNHVVLSTNLEHYEYDNKELKLYLSDDILRIKDNYALKQIYYSYLLLGFEKIYLYVNEEKLEVLNDISLIEGIPFFLANPVYDKYEKIVNVYYKIEKDYIKPVSYFIPKDKDIMDYIMVTGIEYTSYSIS